MDDLIKEECTKPMAPSLCDSCRAPGSCCKGMVLSHSKLYADMPQDEARNALIELGSPNFVPVRKAINGLWMFDCTRLGADGRCTEYESRPYACHAYQPKEDPLCAEYVHALRGIPIKTIFSPTSA